jgi:hypothetical protein
VSACSILGYLQVVLVVRTQRQPKLESLQLTSLPRATGKSSLTVRYCEGHFVESYYPTIENTFSHEIVHKGQTFLTEIIDTAGQVGHTLEQKGILAVPTDS